jgi:hypothetical protein
MNDTNPAQALVEVMGAIFYALLQIHGDDGAEHKAAGFIGEALSSGTIRDPVAKIILAGLVRTAEAHAPPPKRPRYVVESGNVVRILQLA